MKVTKARRFTVEWMKEATNRLRRRYIRRGIIESPISTARISPPAIVEQQRAMRGYSAAMPAAGWTEDITRSNQAIADAWSNEERRRADLKERGEYVSRFGDITADMVFESRTHNVTGLEPAVPALSPLEAAQATTVSDLENEIQMVERSRADKSITVPGRPSKREVLERAGGDEVRAAQVERKLDELYGVEA
jgi:hypothetical protein